MAHWKHTHTLTICWYKEAITSLAIVSTLWGLTKLNFSSLCADTCICRYCFDDLILLTASGLLHLHFDLSFPFLLGSITCFRLCGWEQSVILKYNIWWGEGWGDICVKKHVCMSQLTRDSHIVANKYIMLVWGIQFIIFFINVTYDPSNGRHYISIKLINIIEANIQPVLYVKVYMALKWLYL